MSYKSDEWNNIRKKGLLNYVFYTGVLQYGSVLFISLLIVNHSIKYGELAAIINNFDFSIFLDTFWICIVAGIVFGLSTWFYHERKRSRRKNEVV